MKRYDVLSSHLGDKDYAAGDTRIADPAAVEHLVRLGILKPSDDQADAEGEKPKAESDPLSEALGQIETLTKERDDARGEADKAKGDLAVVTGQRDEALGQIETLTKELAAKQTAGAKPKAQAGN